MYDNYRTEIQQKGRRYIKTAITYAQVITKDVYTQNNGVIKTLEGEVKLTIGDYIAKDENSNLWIISARSIQENKKKISNVDRDGWAQYKNTKSVLALKMDKKFEVMLENNDTIHGSKGDYLVYNGYTYWPVKEEIFMNDYSPIS